MGQGWMMGVAALQAAAAATGGPLQPQDKWRLEYADNACVLSRQFGPPEAGVTLALRPLPIGTSTEFVLIELSDGKDTRTGKARVQIGPSGAQRDGDYVSWAMKDDRHRITTVTISDTQPDLATAATIAIAVDRKRPVVVAPAGIAHAMTAVATCQADLLRSWQIDPHYKDLVATPAKEKSPETWINVNDYPVEALRQGNYGTTTILWTIGVDGAVTGCRIVGRSGSDALDKAACAAITKRGRYAPARDAAGTAIPSYAMRRVVWRLPG